MRRAGHLCPHHHHREDTTVSTKPARTITARYPREVRVGSPMREPRGGRLPFATRADRVGEMCANPLSAVRFTPSEVTPREAWAVRERADLAAQDRLARTLAARAAWKR